MNINLFVFSNNPRFRITRHLLFWTLWILYDTIFITLSWSKFSFTQAFQAVFLVELFSFPMDILFCYAILYILIPRYLYKGRYTFMIACWLFLSLIYIFCFRAYSTHISPIIYSAHGMPYRMHSTSFLWDFFDLFSQINMEGSLAVAIKLGKSWYIKLQELDLLKKEKLKTESEQQDGKLQPVLLINALDKLEMLAEKKPEMIPGMISTLKKLMRYVLYENNQSKVSLKKELQLAQDYIALEKAGLDGPLELHLLLPNNLHEEQIAPSIVLPLIEYSFRQLSLINMPEKHFRLEAKIQAGQFTMATAWNKPIDTATLAHGSNSSLNALSKRLNLIYPYSHHLKIVIKPEEFIVLVKIKLAGAIN